MPKFLKSIDIDTFNKTLESLLQQHETSSLITKIDEKIVIKGVSLNFSPLVCLYSNPTSLNNKICDIES